ncbi:hypothetical protein [Ramlibacter albus]|uniref:Uncharacterized protein n=1 Tax=Ramlibacter albus TaxID=2079448 RepID=A0A923S8F3_9BURK|nr:hypothetical protein [Ramlibacter albus]MBC5768037.1 hypothetical protein [Ramlibacter albus]
MRDDRMLARGNYVLLRAGGLRLLLPQEDVGAAFHVGESSGIELAALSDRMQRLPACPADRFVAASLRGDEGTLWAWNELRVLIAFDLELHALPPSLCDAGSVLRHYALIDGEMAFAVRADAVLAFAEAAHAA